MNAPTSVTLIEGGLVVADANNHRVLFWNQVPTSQPAPPPDLVLGQASAGTCSQQPLRADTLNFPQGTYWDGTYFYLADWTANRVGVYLGIPSSASQEPVAILGQATGHGSSAGHDGVGLWAPTSVAADTQTVWVADSGNHRVVAYDRTSLTTGVAATYCLGQPSCSPGAQGNLANQNQTTPAANTLSAPTGVAIVGTRLFVTDTGNHRIVGYRSAS